MFEWLTKRTFLATTPAAEKKPADLMSNLAYADPSRLMTGSMFSPYNPSVLVTRKGLNIFDQMKLDEQVKVALAFKKAVVLASGWEITSPSDQDAEWEVSSFVREVTEHMEGGFNKALLKILLGVDYGYSISEKMYAEKDGKVVLAGLKSCKPHYFDFVTDNYGALKGLLQRYVPGATDKELPPYKFAVFTYGEEFENKYGKSDLEAAYRPWWTKDNAYKWFAIMLERYGMPPLFAFYNSNYPPAQVNAIQTVLKNIQNATMAMIPRGNKEDIEMWAPTIAGQSKEVFLAALERFDHDIARAILVPSLIGGTPDKDSGSLARSQTHFDMFLHVIKQLQNEVAEVVNSQVVRPLCDINYPLLKSYPQFKFLPFENEQKVELMKTWGELVAGKVVNRIEDDERHIRSLMGFPENENVVLGDLPSNKPPTALEPKEKEFSLHRHTDMAALDRDLTALQDDALAGLQDVFVRMRDELIKQVEDKFNFAPRFVEQVELRRRGELQAQLQELFRAALELGRGTMRQEVLGVKGFAVTRKGSFAPRSALLWLGAKSVTVSGVLQDKIKGEVKMALLSSIQKGTSLPDVIQTLIGIFAPYAGDDRALKGGEEPTPFRLETVVRTNLNEAFNHGRLTEMQHEDIIEHVAGVEYSAILDERTTEVCAFLDGKIFHPHDPDLTALTPPNHFNCRAVVVPILMDEKPDEEDFITNAEKGKAKDLADPTFT